MNFDLTGVGKEGSNGAWGIAIAGGKSGHPPHNGLLCKQCRGESISLICLLQAMQRIESSITAEAKVLADVQAVLSIIKRLSGQEVDNVQSGIAQIRKIRSSVYEDINQIQHEYLILRALRWLLQKGFASEITWEWNARQTGTANEPDLRGSLNGMVLISAEASASEKPVGVIDSRMKLTLHKLSQMAGQKYYFVCSDEMACRARTKIAKQDWPITVVRL
jgi:hypothetical protein